MYFDKPLPKDIEELEREVKRLCREFYSIYKYENHNVVINAFISSLFAFTATMAELYESDLEENLNDVEKLINKNKKIYIEAYKNEQEKNKNK